MTGPPPIDIGPAEWATVLRILRRHVPGREVWAFGSRARRTARPGSDLDLAIVSEVPLPMDIVGAMTEDFTESDLPWKVDVLDWATTDSRFRDLIVRDRVLLVQAADPSSCGPSSHSK